MTGDAEAFARFVGEHELRLRRAFVAAYGTEHGRDATAEASRGHGSAGIVRRRCENPAGYLWRVGRSRITGHAGANRGVPEPAADDVLVEPALLRASRTHGARRAAVLLVHGYGWQLKEVAELMDVRVTTVQNHVERAMAKFRAALTVEAALDA